MILFLFLQLANAQVYFENLDEEIRYNEDPYYASYLQEKSKQIKIEKEAQVEQRRLSAKKKAAEESQRLEFIKNRNKKREMNEAADQKNYKIYVEKRKQRREAHENNRQKFVKERDEDNLTRLEIRRQQLAKMQLEVSRLPASYFEDIERPRVSKKKRKYP